MTATITAPAVAETRVVRKSAFSRHLTIVTRVLTGLLFTTTGLNGWLNFMPAPDPSTMAPAGVAFTLALAATGYMLHLASAVQVVAGLFLLTGRFVPLALALLAPMIVNIVLYHVFLETEGLAIGLFVTVAEIGLAWAYRDKFRPMLQAR
ncbi:DoxX family membrane protein [Lentzea sp. CA-135723]|uniref:DoxX family membrane protein n=1 Tax=Lentzea sp. CA-135723 TaxID=3239950 RepID=UPI003D8E305A